MRSPLSNKVIVYLSILFLIVGAVFYCSDMRMQTEEFLFDLTVKSIPALEPTDKILTIGLETKTFTSDQKKDLLTSVVKKTLDAGVPNIYATYLLSEYNYQEELPVYLADIISTQSQVKLLTLGLNQKHPISLDFPKDLESYKNNLIGIDALRNRSYGIVRKVPTTSYRGTEKSKLFAHDLLEKRGQSKMPMEVALRNIKSNRITVSSVAELPELKHFELVLIGQSEYRPWVSQTVEPPTVNTPFKNNPYKVSEGSSILDFASLQAQNIVQKKEIHILWSPVALFFQIIATILII